MQKYVERPWCSGAGSKCCTNNGTTVFASQGCPVTPCAAPWSGWALEHLSTWALEHVSTWALEHLSNEQCQAKDFWLKKCNLLIESRWGPWVPEEWEPRIQRVSDLSLNYVGWPELRVLHWGPLNIFIWFIDDHWIIYSASWIWFYLDKAYYLHHFTSNIQSPLKRSATAWQGNKVVQIWSGSWGDIINY